jgi:hypothetical protein
MPKQLHLGAILATIVHYLVHYKQPCSVFSHFGNTAGIVSTKLGTKAMEAQKQLMLMPNSAMGCQPALGRQGAGKSSRRMEHRLLAKNQKLKSDKGETASGRNSYI